MWFQAELPKARRSFHHEFVSVTGSRLLGQKRQPVLVDRDFEVSKAMELAGQEESMMQGCMHELVEEGAIP